MQTKHNIGGNAKKQRRLQRKTEVLGKKKVKGHLEMT